MADTKQQQQHEAATTATTIDEGVKDRALGCMVGAFLGDAIGAVLEMMGRTPSAKQVEAAMRLPGGGVHSVGPGQITDDSELALALAQGLLNGSAAGERGFPLGHIAREYHAWYCSMPFDCGITCGGAFRAASKLEREGAEVREYGPQLQRAAVYLNQRSKANGSVMRCTPLAVWGRSLPTEQLGVCCVLDSQLSHCNAACCGAEAAYVLACAHLINHPNDTTGAFDRAQAWLASYGATFAEVSQWLEQSRSRLEPCSPLDGFVKIAFIAAFYHMLHRTPYTDAISTTIAGGGDTDTNAAIVGGMLGALYGYAALPDTLVQQMIHSQPGGRARAERWWPVQLPQMVDSLLAASPTTLEPPPTMTATTEGSLQCIYEPTA